jgi:hypothetical protein
LIRRICLLREQGLTDEAARLEQEDLAVAVRGLRQEQLGEILPESVLREMFTCEEQRVANAVALTELLLPKLLEGLAERTPPGGRVSVPRPAQAVPLSSVSRAPAAGSPLIPDLLDAMLAAEFTNRHPQDSSLRGARTTTRK